MKNRLFKILITAGLTISLCLPSVLMPQKAEAASSHIMSQKVVTAPELSESSQENAYILFGESPKMHNMSFENGEKYTRYEHETFNENVIFGGVQGRQVWKENYIYMRLDPSFASPEDSVFKITIDYWDYSGIGWFFIDYTMPGSDSVYGRVSVLKEGDPEGDPKWHRLTVYITDASFRQCMPYGCDLKIVTNAFNAFSMIEVENLSRKGSTSTEPIGVFNQLQAEALQKLKLMPEIEASKLDAELAREISREELIVNMYKYTGLDKTVEEAKYTTSISGISSENAPYIGYAQNTGVIKQGEKFDASSKATVNEMLTYFMRMLGVKENGALSLLKQARECGLIIGNEVLFQENKIVTVDNIVGLAASALLYEKANGKSLLDEHMDNKRFTGQDIKDGGYDRFYDAILERGFYNGHNTIVDAETGRMYHTVGILGGDAIKNYFTMPLTDSTDTCIYLRDEWFRIFEYNTKTGMMKYIDRSPHLYEHCFCMSAKDGLFYVNQQYQIMRYDCKTGEKTHIIDMPWWWDGSKIGMLQITFDETYLGVEFGNNLATKGTEEEKKMLQVAPERAGAATVAQRTHYRPMFVADLVKKEWKKDIWIDQTAYRYDFNYANHFCINPVNPNLAFYAEEGTAPTSRTWVVDREKQEYIPICNNPDYNIGTLRGESNCHEYWLYDGIRIGYTTGGIWVGRQTNSAIDPLADTAIANWDGSNRKFYGVGSNPNHIHSSPDGRWIVGDGQQVTGQLIQLILHDTLTGKEYLLARIPNRDNPGHVHPQFSWDGKKVYFGLGTPDYEYINVGWMDISDIVDAPLPKGGHYELSETCETFGYEGFDHYIEALTDANDGERYFNIPRDNKMRVDVKYTVSEERHAKAKVKIEYLDKGFGGILFEYRQHETIGAVGRMKDRSRQISRTNSGKWKTAELTFEDINLTNMYLLGADFLISGVMSDAQIRSVDIEILK